MYKIISIKDKEGNEKSHYAKEIHPKLIGNFQAFNLQFIKSRINDPGEIEPRCRFEWADDTGKMMETSKVESFSESDSIIKITTKNSIYVFEKI